MDRRNFLITGLGIVVASQTRWPTGLAPDYYTVSDNAEEHQFRIHAGQANLNRFKCIVHAHTGHKFFAPAIKKIERTFGKFDFLKNVRFIFEDIQVTHYFEIVKLGLIDDLDTLIVLREQTAPICCSSGDMLIVDFSLSAFKI